MLITSMNTRAMDDSDKRGGKTTSEHFTAILCGPNFAVPYCFEPKIVKSVESALTRLLTTSGPRGTFPHLCIMRGCISITEWL